MKSLTGNTPNWLLIDFSKNSNDLPCIACCYVLFFDMEMKYIGSTNNLRNRFSGHAIRHGYAKNIITPWGVFDYRVRITLKYRPTKKYGDWLMLEARLIRKLQPAFNSRMKGRKNALLPS